MTLNDFLKRVSEEDRHKMIIYSEDGVGWTNINVEILEENIIITPDVNVIFSSDK